MRLSLFDGGVMIYAYTRAQAIDEGSLIDVTDLARDAGFKVPVALTAKVWSDCVAWEQAREIAPQDETGRLWDVLTMARMAVRSQINVHRARFSVLRIASGHLRPSRARLDVLIGSGDQGEPVITIMQPEED